MGDSSSSPDDLIQTATAFRENDRLTESLDLFDQAATVSVRQKNYPALIHALHGKALSCKHLFLNSQDLQFRQLALSLCQSALKICQDHHLTSLLSLCYFRLGEMHLLFADYPAAIVHYRRSLKLFGPENAAKGNITYHLGEAIFLSGDKDTGINTVLDGLKILKQYRHSTDTFQINVWLSGCYLKLAKFLASTDSRQAKKYLSQAQKIVDSDPRLVIRCRQLQSLSSFLKS